MKRIALIAVLSLSISAFAAQPVMQGTVTWQGVNIAGAVVSIDSTSCNADGCTAQLALFPTVADGKARTNAAGQIPLAFTHVAGKDQNTEAQSALIVKYPSLVAIP